MKLTCDQKFDYTDQKYRNFLKTYRSEKSHGYDYTEMYTYLGYELHAPWVPPMGTIKDYYNMKRRWLGMLNYSDTHFESTVWSAYIYTRIRHKILPAIIGDVMVDQPDAPSVSRRNMIIHILMDGWAKGIGNRSSVVVLDDETRL